MNPTARLRQILMQLEPGEAYSEALELVREIERASYGEGLTITDDDGDKVEFFPSLFTDRAVMLRATDAFDQGEGSAITVRLTAEDLVAIVAYINYVQEEK